MVTVGLVVGVGFVLINRSLSRSEVGRNAAAQRADARGFEAFARRVKTRVGAIREIDDLIDAIGRRPGTLEVKLIDGRGIVRASDGEAEIGSRDLDSRITAALHGDS